MDADTVLRLRGELLEVWRGAHKNWRDWEDVVNQKHKIRVVKPAEPRRLSFARSKIQSMVDTMVTNSPRVSRDPRAETQEAKAEADKVEKWGKGVLYRLAAVKGMVPPFKMAALYLALLGYSVMKARWDTHAWPQKPDGRNKAKLARWEEAIETAFPFILEVPHPARVLMPPFEREVSLAIESRTVSTLSLQEEFPLLSVNQPRAMLEVVEYWDKERRAVVADGQLVYEKANPFGFVPYTHAYAGFGWEGSPVYTAGSTPADPSLGPSPEEYAQGLLSSSIDVIKSMDEWFSAMLALSLRTAYRSVFTTGDAEELARNFAEAGLGSVIEQGVNEEIKWEEPPRVDPWLFQVLGIAREDAEGGTYAGEVQGQKSPGVETATQHALMLGMARQKFGVPMEQLNYMANLVLGFCARMMIERGEKVNVGGVRVRAEDFRGNYDFKVDFLSLDEGALLRTKEGALRELQAGAIDFETYQAVAGRTDVSGLRRRVALDRIMQNPMVDEMLIQLVFPEFQQWALGQKAARPQEQPGLPKAFVPAPGPEQAAAGFQGMVQTPGGGITRVGR